MTTPPQSDAERRRAWIFIVVFAALIGASALRPVNEPDAFWNVHEGAKMLSVGATRYTDETSFVKPGVLYSPKTPLASLTLYGAHRAAGEAGLALYAALFGALSVIAVGALALSAAGTPSRAVLSVGLVAAAIQWRLLPRPATMMLLLIPLALWLARLWVAAPSGASRRRLAIALVVVGLLWPQLHSSFILLPVLVALPLVAAMFEARGHVKEHLPRVLFPLALSLGFLVSPGGLRAFPTFIASYLRFLPSASLDDATLFIQEMRPLELVDLVPNGFGSVFFLDLLIVLAASSVVRTRRLRLDDLGAFVLGVALAFTSRRFRDAWALLMTPAVAHGDTSGPPWRPRAEVALGLAAVLLSMSHAMSRDPTRGFGFGVDDRRLPVHAAAALGPLLGSRRDGRVLNLLEDGGYLAMSGASKLRVAIDGRTPNLYDAEDYFRFRKLFTNDVAFAAFDARYAPNLALLPNAADLCRQLAGDLSWAPVYLELGKTLFVRTSSRGAPRLSVLPACGERAQLFSRCATHPEMIAALRVELAAIHHLDPSAPYPLVLGSQIEGRCAGGSKEEALRLAEGALDRGPRWPEAFDAVAHANADLGRAPLALAAIEDAIHFEPTTARAIDRAALLRELGRHADAAAVLQALEKSLRDDLPIDARVALARALQASGQSAKARLEAERAAWLGAGAVADILGVPD